MSWDDGLNTAVLLTFSPDQIESVNSFNTAAVHKSYKIQVDYCGRVTSNRLLSCEKRTALQLSSSCKTTGNECRDKILTLFHSFSAASRWLSSLHTMSDTVSFSKMRCCYNNFSSIVYYGKVSKRATAPYEVPMMTVSPSSQKATLYPRNPYSPPVMSNKKTGCRYCKHVSLLRIRWNNVAWLAFRISCRSSIDRLFHEINGDQDDGGAMVKTCFWVRSKVGRVSMSWEFFSCWWRR